MERMRKDFTTLTFVLITVGIAINIAVGELNYAFLKLPVYLDSIGTVLVGVLAGPWAGALTGLLANFIWGITGWNVQYMPFMLVAGVIGLLAGLIGEMGWMRTWWKVILAGIITGVVASLLSAPISAYVFGGVTGAGTDVLVAAFRQLGAGVLGASFMQGAVSDPIDKTATYLLVWIILAALPRRFVALFPRAENVRGGGMMSASQMGSKPSTAVAGGMPARSDSMGTMSDMSGKASMPAAKPAPPRKTVPAKKPVAKKPAAKTPAAKVKAPARPKPKSPARKTTRG